MDVRGYSGVEDAAPRQGRYARGSPQPSGVRAAAARSRAPARDDRRGVDHRRSSGRRSWRRRAYRRAALSVRHATRPADLGRQPPGLSAQDPDGAERTGFARCASRAACRASPGASKANTTRSARPTLRPRSRPVSAWPWRATLMAATTTSICVIGDGAMSAGMAYEAMNNAGALAARLIVVLNDNNMSIAPPTGALSTYLARITSSRSYLFWRNCAKRIAKCLPSSWERRVEPARAIRSPSLAGRRVVRGARFLLCRPDRRARFPSALAGAEECPRRGTRADPRPRRHQKGQRLRTGRGLRGQISWRRPSSTC